MPKQIVPPFSKADITDYIEITQEKMARAEKCSQIAELKAELARTDHQARRQALRDQINELEEQL